MYGYLGRAVTSAEVRERSSHPEEGGEEGYSRETRTENGKGGGATRSENVIRRARLRQPLLAGELVDGRAERENVRFREVHIHVRVQLCK